MQLKKFTELVGEAIGFFLINRGYIKLGRELLTLKILNTHQQKENLINQNKTYM